MAKQRFEYKLTLGKTLDGKLIRKSFYSTKSKKEAKRKAEEYRAKYELEHFCGGTPEMPRVLFKTWAINCLELYKKPFVAGNTYSGTYLAPVQNHLIPHFGNLALTEIAPFQVQQYINDISKKYSPETVKKDYTALKFIMQVAVDNGLCAKNPVNSSVRLPRYEAVREKRAYTQAEYDTAYTYAKTHPLGLDIMMLMETGVSRSELLGLTWKNLDLDAGVLYVEQGLVGYQDLANDTWRMEASGLKNRYRKRMIPIVDSALLERLKNKPRMTENGVSTEYVFHSPEGHAYQPQNWGKRVYQRFQTDLLAEHPELPRLSPHELRHTRATLWIAQGVEPYMVMRLLGHSDLKMLTKIYDHTDVETLRQAIE